MYDRFPVSLKDTCYLILVLSLSLYISCSKGKTGQGLSNKEMQATGSKENIIEPSTEQGAQIPTPPDDEISPREKLVREMFEPDKYTYVLFYDKSNMKSVYQSKIIDLAAPKLKPKANVIKIDREDPKNKTILELFNDAEDFKVPLTVLYMPDRYPIRKFYTLISEDTLLKAIPSPIHEKVIYGYRHNKMGLLCFYKESMKEFPELDKTCKQAVQKLQGLLNYYPVHMEDPQEQHFMWKMNIEKDNAVPTVVIVNKLGKGDRRFEGTVSLIDLVAAIKAELARPTK